MSYRTFVLHNITWNFRRLWLAEPLFVMSPEANRNFGRDRHCGSSKNNDLFLAPRNVRSGRSRVSVTVNVAPSPPPSSDSDGGRDGHRADFRITTCARGRDARPGRVRVVVRRNKKIKTRHGVS